MYNALFAEINPRHELAPLTDTNINNKLGANEAVIVILALLLSLAAFTGLCLAIGVVVIEKYKGSRFFMYEVELSKLFD